MKRKKISQHGCGGQLAGVVVFLIGLVLLFLVPVGTVIGAILILLSLSMGYSTKKVWQCKSCRSVIDRA